MASQVVEVEEARACLLDDVALQDDVDDQPARPLRQHGTERDVQLIEGEPVAVLAQVGHRQPAGQLHAAAVVMPAVVVLVPGVLLVGGVVVLVVCRAHRTGRWGAPSGDRREVPQPFGPRDPAGRSQHRRALW